MASRSHPPPVYTHAIVHDDKVIRRYSRRRYARPVGQVEAEIHEAFTCT